MQAYNKKTLKEIKNGFVSDFYTRLKKETPLLQKSVINSMGYAIAGIAKPMWNTLEWLYLQLFPETCSFPVLKMWGRLFDVKYKNGTDTVLQVEMGNVTASSLMSSTVFKNLDNNVIYKSVSGVNTESGHLIFNVAAQVQGSAGNLNPGDTLYLTTPLPGIPEKATVLSVLITGSEPEEKEDYRKRVILRCRKKPQGGALADYSSWALEVSGIADAIPYVLKTGTVTVFLVGAGSGINRTPSGSLTPNPFPEWENGQMKALSGSGLFFQVAKSINGTEDELNRRRPTTAAVELKPCNYYGFRIDITGLTPNNNEVIGSIKREFNTYLDKKRPNVPAVGYTEQDALINTSQLNAIAQNAVSSYGGTFETFLLKDETGTVINSKTLGIGELAYLKQLFVNETDVVL